MATIRAQAYENVILLLRSDSWGSNQITNIRFLSSQSALKCSSLGAFKALQITVLELSGKRKKSDYLIYSSVLFLEGVRGGEGARRGRGSQTLTEQDLGAAEPPKFVSYERSYSVSAGTPRPSASNPM